MSNEQAVAEVVEKADDQVQPEAQPEEKVEPEAKVEPEKKADEKPQENHDVRRMRKFMERAAKAEAELAVYKQQSTQQPASPDKPTREQFQDDAAYIDALTDWKLEKRLPEVVNKISSQSAQAGIQTSFQQRETEARAKYSDYDEVVADADIPIPQETVEAMLSSEYGPDIRYFLAKNPEQAAKLNQMPRMAAVREIGKIEARIEAEKSKPKPKPTNAPAPIKPVNPSGGTVETDLDKLPTAEFIKRRNKADWERRKK